MTNRREFFKKASLVTLAAGVAPALARASDFVAPIRSDKKRVLRLAHITDVHILPQANAEAGFDRVLAEINAMPDRPDFIINTGDTVMDENRERLETVEARWNVWHRLVKAGNDLEIKSALGNHDVWNGPNHALDLDYRRDRRYGKQWAIDALSLPHRYYSFERNGWKFIALDSINGEDGYQLDDAQFVWLDGELSKSPATPVCIYNHVPILSVGAMMYTTRRKPLRKVKFPKGDMHSDHQRIKDLFVRHPQVKICLSGHVHYVEALDYLGVSYLCNGAVSGNWWGNPIALDEFPPAYAIIDLHADGTFEHRIVNYQVTA